MEIKDLAGMSEPLTKLIDAIVKGCKWIAEPYQIKRIADANAYASSVQSKEDFKQGLRNSLLEYTQRSMLSVRENRQIENLANIINYAGQELRAIDKINDTPVSSEWSSRFFDYAQNVYEEEAQTIWAKILAQETATPGKFFKRTLDILHNIEPFEAKWFAELCQFVLDDTFVHKDIIHSKFFEYNKLQSMIDCGLLNAQECIISFDNTVDSINFKSYYLKKGISQLQPSNISMSGFTLTDAGCQLYKITQISSNLEFVKKIQEQIKNNYGLNFEIMEYKTQEHQ
ncbi:DUF2806 domain-containing protein [uncultured Bacteroides sp.]|uniref:DUF2806 domain-containing protein n=1 Tax=uncultured Bacteroides sp. TaxID=162156 RepID=UPI002608B8FA|nr:DUF2806 domain-containing protein [uncultured Bacteroides sp.]